jgi:heme exporter protein C
MRSEILHLLKLELLLDLRQKHAWGAMVLYVISAIYVCYLAVKSGLGVSTWNALFWIILLFAAFNALARSFQREDQGRQLYLHTLAGPRSVVLARTIYNAITMVLLGLLSLFFYMLFLGTEAMEQALFGDFVLAVVLGCIGFAAVLTLISAIAARGRERAGIDGGSGLPHRAADAARGDACEQARARRHRHGGERKILRDAARDRRTHRGREHFALPLPLARLMRHWWWKILSVVLLLTASIAALRVPLASAIVHVSPDRIAPGPVTLDVLGYSTTFSDPEVRLVNGGQRLCPTSVEVVDETHLKATFMVPNGLREHLTDVVVDGYRMPEALFTEGLGDGADIAGDCDEAYPRLHALPSIEFPNRTILYESIRNLNFHVPMWFTMIVLMGISFVQSLSAIRKNSIDHDLAASAAARVGLVFCVLGLITGSIWARFTWGAWWTSDVKLNGAAVGALIYLAYFVLRGSVTEAHKRLRLAGVYNIFAFSLLIVLLFVLPRLNDSLHPGNGGNPAFSNYDLDNRLRMVFYPAVMGWIGMGVWMYDLKRRLALIQNQIDR